MGVGQHKFKLVFGLLIALILVGFVSSARTNSFLERGQATDTISSFFKANLTDRPSPCDRVSEKQILVYKDRIIINYKDAEWATFTDTNSMDPVIDIGANALEYVPKDPKEICEGDIVSYKSKYAKGVLIHRVVETGFDNKGWYAILKGDNSPYKDPGKVRFDQLQRVVIGIIY
ncbi:MAG: hypothetical protein MAG795_00960 [Candidatus Woesearchaeota archaeon]|nr:hypothetical protein [Candidatus Woesearchaeota archaeon]